MLLAYMYKPLLDRTVSLKDPKKCTPLHSIANSRVALKLDMELLMIISTNHIDLRHLDLTLADQTW